METSQRNIIIGGIILVVLGVGAYLYISRIVPSPETLPDDIAVATTSVSDIQNEQEGGAVPVTISVGGTMKTPSLSRPLSFSAGISDEAKVALRIQFDTVTGQLTKNSNQMDLWISLGTIRKSAGDYAGAIEDWSFVAVDRNSLSYIAYGNLADLYSNFVKDYPKAEASYLAAISLEPTYIDFYRGLFTLYANLYKKGTSAAENILKKGIVANPKAVDLQVTLAQYYLSQGRTADAKAQYDVAIANAKSQGLTTLAAQIESEKSSL